MINLSPVPTVAVLTAFAYRAGVRTIALNAGCSRRCWGYRHYFITILGNVRFVSSASQTQLLSLSHLYNHYVARSAAVTAFLVTAELSSPMHEYSQLHKELLVLNAYKALGTAWFVEASLSAPELCGVLTPCIHPDDGLLVVQLRRRLSWAFANACYPGAAFLTNSHALR